MVWLGAQTLAIKPITLLGNLALAWLLVPEVFGLVGMAYTVTTFVDLIQQAGVNQVLIHRHRSYQLWSNPAFWMSMATGLLASAVVLVSAPIAATVFREPQLIGLLGLMAVAPPIRALSLVPLAKLQIDLRFALLAKTMVFSIAIQTCLAVLFAWLGFGAYSVILPVPIAEAFRMTVYWWHARPRIRLNAQLRRWPYLVSDTMHTLGAQFCYTVVQQGDYIILAVLYGAGELGLYYFSFNLSLQSLNIFSTNLAKVLFPTLSQLQEDRPRQTRAFIRAARLLTLVAVPGCIFQAALADDFIHALYHPEWYGAAPLLRVFSIALSFRTIGGSVLGLIMAQGRFRFHMNWAISSMTLFLTLVLVGASYSVFGAALGVLVYSIFMGPMAVYLAIRAGGGRWRDVWDIFSQPMFAAAAAAATGWLVSRAIPEVPGIHWWRMATIGIVGGGLYLAFIWRLAPDQVQEFRRRAADMLSRAANKRAIDRNST